MFWRGLGLKKRVKILIFKIYRFLRQKGHMELKVAIFKILLSVCRTFWAKNAMLLESVDYIWIGFKRNGLISTGSMQN